LAILFRPFGFLAPRSKQDSQNLGGRKPKGINRIAKIKGSKQDRQNLGARKPKGLNRIDKIKGSKEDSQNQKF
jgi:hypothetical protein